jgi:hypothetical protein
VSVTPLNSAATPLLVIQKTGSSLQSLCGRAHGRFSPVVGRLGPVAVQHYSYLFLFLFCQS